MGDINLQTVKKGIKKVWGLPAHITLWSSTLLFTLYQHVTDSQASGFLHDDGIYALTSKALAEGKGYQLLNLTGPGLSNPVWQVKYPILYPLILSLGWLIQPHFPQNLHWLQGLTMAFAVASIPLLYGYLRKAKQASCGMATLICLLVAANFHYIYFATSLMSEAPYFLFSLLALWLAETQEPPCAKQRLAGLILLSTLAFHTRTIGITLIAAIFMAMALRKQWKNAGTYLGITLLLTAIPWAIWVKQHSINLSSLNFPLTYVYGGYGIEYGVNSPHELGAYLQALMSNGLEPLINNFGNLMFPQVAFWLNPYPLAYDVLCLGLAGLLIITGIRAVSTRKFSASGLYVAFYLLSVTLWMYPNQAIRFSIMLLPWFWLHSFRGSKALVEFCLPERFKFKRPQWSKVLSLSLIGAFLLWPSIAGYNFLYRLRSQHIIVPGSSQVEGLWQDYQDTFRYIQQHTPDQARVAGMWDPIFYLYANRPSFGLFTSSLQPINGHITPESFQRLRDSMVHYGVQTIVVEPFIVNQQVQAPKNPVAMSLIQQFPQEFQLVYTAPHALISVYRFQPQ